jgi:hypothetical protein
VLGIKLMLNDGGAAHKDSATIYCWKTDLGSGVLRVEAAVQRLNLMASLTASVLSWPCASNQSTTDANS